MTITQLQLYNGALRLCGEGKLASLTEDRGPRHLLDDVWGEDTIEYCLEQGQWRFATRTQQLTFNPAINPDFGYSRGFDEPTDYVRTVMLSSNEYFDEALTRFEHEGGLFFADLDQIYLRFVSKDVLYGKNLGLWPKSFAKYVQSYLAFEVAPRLTGVKVDMEKLEKVMDDRLKKAQSIDGINRPTRFPPKGSWNNARLGRNSQYTDSRRR